jgi:TolB-like protein
LAEEPEFARPSIAVLPFDNLSDDPDQELIANGMTDDIITALSKFPHLLVIARHSTFAYKNKSVQISEIARELGVCYVLGGSIRRVGPRIRVNAQLIDALGNSHIWAESYDRDITDLFVLLDYIAEQIVNAVGMEVYRDGMRRSVPASPAQLRAWETNMRALRNLTRPSRALKRLPEELSACEAWLRGEHLLRQWAPRSEDEAERLFEHAISEGETFAPAYASLASVYNTRHLTRPGLQRRPETQKRAVELARRAVELDPRDARNLMAMAWSAAMGQRFEQAELYFELAPELNPNDPKVVVSASLGLAFMGRLDGAQQLLDHAISLTTVLPAYQWSYIATIRFLAGNYAGTVEAADRSQDVIINTPGWKAAALGKLGRAEEQRAALDQLVQAAESDWAGSPNPSREDVMAWFLGAFPIRHDGDRQNLAASLRSG